MLVHQQVTDCSSKNPERGLRDPLNVSFQPSRSSKPDRSSILPITSNDPDGMPPFRVALYLAVFSAQKSHEHVTPAE